jgi:DNA-binding transcriptional MocR family regulator
MMMLHTLHRVGRQLQPLAQRRGFSTVSKVCSLCLRRKKRFSHFGVIFIFVFFFGTNPLQAERVSTFGTTVWAEFTPLAVAHKAVNLGQGFPDYTPQEGHFSFIVEATQEALKNNVLQYTRTMGHLRLVKALANHFSPLYGRNLDPMTEIITTVGKKKK